MRTAFPRANMNRANPDPHLAIRLWIMPDINATRILPISSASIDRAMHDSLKYIQRIGQISN